MMFLNRSTKSPCLKAECTRRPMNGMRRGRKALGIALSVASTLAMLVPAAKAGGFEIQIDSGPPTEAADSWQIALGLHGWGPEIDTTLSNGIEVDLGLDDILGDLRMAAMLGVAAERGR